MNQTEAVVAQVNDLQDGQMQLASVGETKVLLAKVGGNFYAVGAFCTHYQAPLTNGALRGDRVICPWHNACFNVVTGDQENPPGLDSLARYDVRIDGEDVIVRVPTQTTGRRTLPMAQHNPDADGRTFVILGAGAAGTHAAEALRQEGFEGRVVMVTKEDKLPYDRTWLSKDYFTGKVEKEDLPLRSPEFYQRHDIEVLLNQTVLRVEVANKKIFLSDGELSYDAVLVATGGKVNQLPMDGQELQNVFTLRSFADTEKILAAAQSAKQAVVVGSSFIGMETAAGLTKHGVKVTVVSPESVPFEPILGAEIGKLFQEIHEENGVSFQLGRKASGFVGEQHVEAVLLDNDERLEADLVVVGIGVKPATEFLEGIELQEDQSIKVDKSLCAADGLYAAGDIATYPTHTGEPTRIEHWRVAAAQGRVAAANMTGLTVEYQDVPIFWTMQFKFPLRYVGHADEWDAVIVDGKLEERQFIAYYIKSDRVVAAASSKRDTETAAIYELMRLQQMPIPAELRQGSVDLVARLQA
ncbi:MAG: FAD-dependent oxidoreductase [Cyanophyceae cyanobacterium]